MKTILILTIVSVTLCFASCDSSYYEPSAYGDPAAIDLRNNVSYSGELLCIDDSYIYLISQEKIYAISSKKIDNINIDKYSDRSWIFGVILLEVVPSVVISGIAASMTDVNFGLVLGLTMIPAVISTLLFESSTPPGNYDNVTSKKTKADLHKFTRYPGGITTSQLNDLLKTYGQDSCIYIK